MLHHIAFWSHGASTGSRAVGELSSIKSQEEIYKLRVQTHRDAPLKK